MSVLLSLCVVPLVVRDKGSLLVDISAEQSIVVTLKDTQLNEL